MLCIMRCTEGTVSGDDQRLALIAAVDDFVEQVGGLVVEGKIAHLIAAQQPDIGVGAQFAAADLGGLAMQFFVQRGGGA